MKIIGILIMIAGALVGATGKSSGTIFPYIAGMVIMAIGWGFWKSDSNSQDDS